MTNEKVTNCFVSNAMGNIFLKYIYFQNSDSSRTTNRTTNDQRTHAYRVRIMVVILSMINIFPFSSSSSQQRDAVLAKQADRIADLMKQVTIFFGFRSIDDDECARVHVLCDRQAAASDEKHAAELATREKSIDSLREQLRVAKLRAEEVLPRLAAFEVVTHSHNIDDASQQAGHLAMERDGAKEEVINRSTAHERTNSMHVCVCADGSVGASGSGDGASCHVARRRRHVAHRRARG
jgi:hypothetical protein